MTAFTGSRPWPLFILDETFTVPPARFSSVSCSNVQGPPFELRRFSARGSLLQPLRGRLSFRPCCPVWISIDEVRLKAQIFSCYYRIYKSRSRIRYTQYVALAKGQCAAH